MSARYPTQSATQKASENATDSVACKRKTRDLASHINILGGGYRRWPVKLDQKLVRRIIEIEIGSRLIRAGAAPSPSAPGWK